MDKVGGPLGVTVIAVVAALVILLGILHFGFHVFRRRKGKGRGKAGALSESRVEVLESTVIDEERRLVLIRCDRIEHLIMVGGPADLVVENDVRKVRGPGAPAAKIPGFETEKRAPAVQRPASSAAIAPEPAIASAPRTAEPRGVARPVPEPRQTPPRPVPAIQPPAGRAGASRGEPFAPAAPRVEEPGRALVQRPQALEPRSGRRDPAPPRRSSQSLPAPISRASEPLRAPSTTLNDRGSRSTRSSSRPEPSPALPAAQIPWSDPDSIENEIVRALRFDPKTRSDQPGARREPPSAKAINDSHTTLGDLADRLEEALAREVQSARQPQPEETTADEFGFETEAPTPEPERAKPVQKERSEKRERPESGRPTAIVSAPEPEAKREPSAPAERREEAPVISLNSRRRESADQLEDEMARLLGELTTDTKGR